MGYQKKTVPNWALSWFMTLDTTLAVGCKECKVTNTWFRGLIIIYKDCLVYHIAHQKFLVITLW